MFIITDSIGFGISDQESFAEFAVHAARQAIYELRAGQPGLRELHSEFKKVFKESCEEIIYRGERDAHGVIIQRDEEMEL
jgi:hypothetical protein